MSDISNYELWKRIEKLEEIAKRHEKKIEELLKHMEKYRGK